MIPNTFSPQTESQAEIKVFESLKNSLDDSYTVFHSFDIMARNLENRLIDVEIDFLIFSIKHGILILEVKGGSIAYDGTRWLQNGNPLSRSPYSQARDNKYAISDFLKKRLNVHNKITMGHAVCFPDVFTPITNLPAEAETSISLTGKELPHIDSIITTIMESYKKDQHKSTSNAESEIIRKILMPQFEYGTSLTDMIGIADQKILKLTDEQCSLLDFLGDRHRVLINGGAGTGKTVMALKKAREFALADKKVLLLCFNRPLKEVLEKSVGKIKGDIIASNYHSFTLQKLHDAGMDIKP